jgi:hypothetical protein
MLGFLCATSCVLCVSVVWFYSEFINHRDTEVHREERDRDLCKPVRATHFRSNTMKRVLVVP